jgi:hypothetical protein
MDSGGNNGYFIDLNIATGATNNIRIVEIASGTGTVTTQVDQGTVSIGNVYTMTLTGTYADTNADTIKDLILSLTVTGTGMSGTPVTWTDTAGVKTGTYFGFRNRTASTDINVDFDNLSVVPEPSTYALVAGGIAFLAFLRRRKD